MIYDILIKNAAIISMSKDTPGVLYGCIGIKGTEISYIGKDMPAADFKTVIDAAGNIVMPGLINAHTHSPMSVYRGYADDIPLFRWLNDHIWPAEKKFVTEKNIAPASELSIAEMIRSGTTTFNDMYFYSEITAAAAEKAGIRAVLGEAVIDLPVPLYRFSEDYWKIKTENFSGTGLVKASLVPHSPYSCSKKVLKEVKKIAEKTGTIIHTHISETRTEVDHIRKKHGVSPVEYLDSIGFLDENVIAVHCAVLSDTDIEILSRRKVNIVHCPQSNMKMASGIARIAEMKNAGMNIALGTDGQASNNTLDMFAEMKMTALLHKAVNNDPTIMNAREVLEMGTINAAKMLGLEKLTGSIEEGKKADIIIIDTNSLHLSPMYDPYSHLVYAARGSDVETVIINGRIVMKNRKLLTINEASLKKKIAVLSRQIGKFRKTNGAAK